MKKYKLINNDKSYRVIEANHIEVKEGFLIIYEPLGSGYRLKGYLKAPEGSYLEVVYDE